MIKLLMATYALTTAIYSNAESAGEINLLCSYVNTNSDTIALTLNLNNSRATSVALVGPYVGAISTYEILTTSNEYILKENESILEKSTTQEDTISSWSLDRQNLKAIWKVKIHGRLAIQKEATCRIFKPENKI